MTTDEKFKQAEAYLAKKETELSNANESAERGVQYDQDEELRRETLSRQLGLARSKDCGCVTAMSREGELVDDYDLCAHCN